MANFSSLQDLYQAAPTMGALLSGQRFAQEQEASTLANQQAQQTIDQNAVMNPLNAQFKQGEIASQQAQLPGLQADSTLKQNRASLDSATLGQQLQAKQSELATKMSADELARTRTIGEKMSALGAALQGVPPVQRASLVAQQAQAMGLDLNSPYVQTFLKAPPDQMPKLLSDTGQRMALATGDHQRKMDETRFKENAANQRASTLANSKVYTADAAAGNKAAALDPQVIFNKIPHAKGKHAFSIAEAYKAEAAGDTKGAEYWNNIAARLRPQAEAEIKSATPGTPDVGAMSGLPTQAGPSIAPGGGPKPAAPQHSFADVQKMYPNVSPDELKAKYKQKYGVDLK